MDLLRRAGADDFACSSQLLLLEQFKKLNSQGVTAHVNERKMTAWKVTHWKARINSFHGDQGSLRELTVTEGEAQVIEKRLNRSKKAWGSLG